MKKTELMKLLENKPDDSDVFYVFNDSYNTEFKCAIRRVYTNENGQILMDSEQRTTTIYKLSAGT